MGGKLGSLWMLAVSLGWYKPQLPPTTLERKNHGVLTGAGGAFKGSEMTWIIPLEATISHSTIALLSTYLISLCQQKEQWELSFDPLPFGNKHWDYFPTSVTDSEKNHTGGLCCCLPGHLPGLAPGCSWLSYACSSHHHYLHLASRHFLVFFVFWFLKCIFKRKVFVMFVQWPSSA